MKLGLFATIFAFDEDREAEPAEVRHDERRIGSRLTSAI